MNIESPYHKKSVSIVITKEQVEQIKKILGTNCVFVACMPDGSELCNEEDCNGHPTSVGISNWTSGALLGLADQLNKKFGGL